MEGGGSARDDKEVEVAVRGLCWCVVEWWGREGEGGRERFG